MAQVTGTLAGVNDLLSNEPTDLHTIKLRISLLSISVQTILESMTAKMAISPQGTLDSESEDVAVKMLGALQTELEMLRAAKARLERRI